MGAGASAEVGGGGGSNSNSNSNNNGNGNGNGGGSGAAAGPAKSLSEGFWPAGWLNPGELGTPLFEVWPDKFTPTALHQAHAGQVVFGKDAGFAKQAEPRVFTRFNTQDRIFGTAFLRCRVTRYCVGYKRPQEMWRPLHHFCYLTPTQGAWVAYYLYVDDKAVCPSSHKTVGLNGNANGNGNGNGNGTTAGASTTAAGSNAATAGATRRSGSLESTHIYDQDEVEVESDGEDEDDERLDPHDIFSTAFFVYRLPPEELATTTALPVVLVPDPDTEHAASPGPLHTHQECWVRFARLLCALPAGIHRFSLEVRILFEDGNKRLVGYHPATKTVADNFMQGEPHCLGPSEVLALGDFALTINRRDRKALLARARVQTSV